MSVMSVNDTTSLTFMYQCGGCGKSISAVSPNWNVRCTCGNSMILHEVGEHEEKKSGKKEDTVKEKSMVV